eukprot:CAMPEP_0182586244 /NCGR_PEP_ID=MMETSP1324-20130603/62126_1 /TAXON_ID=236786 /ORGANISM="Florenciella sp., Strain RCC1587" /LENGTH=45 /DNA_ID= /DNA_START= /DNA_END= /DNA_ORIENTATION=
MEQRHTMCHKPLPTTGLTRNAARLKTNCGNRFKMGHLDTVHDDFK